MVLLAKNCKWGAAFAGVALTLLGAAPAARGDDGPVPQQPAAAVQQPGATTAPAPTGGQHTISEPEKAALIEMIRQKALEAQQGAAERLAKEPQAAVAASGPAPVRPPTQLVPPGHQTATQPATAPAKGCHGTGPQLDMVPPPEGSPQPKFVGETKATTENAWAGKPVTFAYEITNGGEAPLHLYLKPG